MHRRRSTSTVGGGRLAASLRRACKMGSAPSPSDRHELQGLTANGRRPTRKALRLGIVCDPEHFDPLVRRLTVAQEWCVAESISLDGENDFGLLNNYDAVLLVDSAGPDDDANDAILKETHARLDLLRKRQIGVLVSTRRPWRYAGFNCGVVCFQPDSSFEMARGALCALAHIRPMILQLDKQYSAMQRLGRNLARRFDATNRELQLASRLQRDFLPHGAIESGPFRFSTLFRPCSWVSGDIFDIFRLDETHWGFYLADAVGHGVAAGLLTMYIKHAIRPKRILREGYEIVPPSEVLSHLNDLLAQQGLPDSQFITGWYGILDTETRVLRYAVAGHPPALLLSPDNDVRELHGEGCLLGLGVGERYSDESVTLRPGDRVFIYSDGLEPMLIAHRPPLPRLPVFESGMLDTLRLSSSRLIEELRTMLDAAPGSLAQPDDVSVLVLDFDEREAPGSSCDDGPDKSDQT
ncbi:MAG: serine/threonine-protein phosphatase [Phycisphaerae bacterium]|nr:serine/threonine-protein phosphatase [Phycisphaerae bacterium]